MLTVLACLRALELIFDCCTGHSQLQRLVANDLTTDERWHLAKPRSTEWYNLKKPPRPSSCTARLRQWMPTLMRVPRCTAITTHDASTIMHDSSR